MRARLCLLHRPKRRAGPPHPAFRGGERHQVLEEKTWIWVSDLPAATVPATRIQRWGMTDGTSKIAASMNW